MEIVGFGSREFETLMKMCGILCFTEKEKLLKYISNATEKIVVLVEEGIELDIKEKDLKEKVIIVKFPLKPSNYKELAEKYLGYKLEI